MHDLLQLPFWPSGVKTREHVFLAEAHGSFGLNRPLGATGLNSSCFLVCQLSGRPVPNAG